MFYDKDFLLQLDKTKNKTIYARITALTFQEQPIETVEGRVTTGSINVDGSAAVRRTCSLTMVAENFDYQNYYWGINTKFKLEVGIENLINPHYPDIIWFNQGIYVFTSFNTSRNTNSFTISLQGKDKMCLLNGEVGGSLESSVDFGTIEEETEEGIWVIKKIPIFEIIRNMIHTYAGEPYHNIIINDLNDYGLELLEYRYDVPMYLYRSIDSPIYTNILLNGDKECSVEGTNITKLKDLTSNELEMLVDALTGTSNPKPVTIEGADYYVAKIEYGQTAGYRETELTYAGDLIANVGESITSVLDKIKNMLSEFEYFYDVDGRFIFQRKQSFVNTLWTPVEETEEQEKYVESIALASANTYTFNDGELISAFNNTPNLSNMRNDYSVWGTRTSASGATIPVHLRYAIDKKPTYYKNFNGEIFMTKENAYNQVIEQKRDEILNEVYERVKKFKLSYSVPEELGGNPERQDDNTWSSGWWDIRDWYEFYSALTLTAPNYTMKWYSQNNMTGCVKSTDLNIEYTQNLGGNNYVWLLIKQPDGKYNAQHGNGNPNNAGFLCTKYESYFNEEGALKTTKVENAQKEYFIPPYSGCNDSHTYLEFLINDINKQGNSVYFYNPKFPGFENQKDIIEEQVKNEFEEYLKAGKLHLVDWREIIYQMALDYYQHNTKDDFELTLRENNLDYYPTGQTGYERYYIDLQGFWRQIYNPFLKAEKEEQENKKILLEEKKDEKIHQIQNEKLKEDEKDAAQIKAWELELDTLNQKIETIEKKLNQIANDLENFYPDNHVHAFWLSNVYEFPETLNFWFDFLDADGELAQFNVKAVGSRPKSINDTNIKSIYFRETPDIIFITSDLDENKKLDGYKYIQVQNIESMFSISAQGKSAKNRLDELIYQHGYCIESATITTIPIYYLQPNIRVHLRDQDTNLNGDYIISKITIPLTYNGTMSLTATKAAESII